MKIAKPMTGKNKFVAFSQNNILIVVCALTLLLTGCQSSQSSSSSSSTSTPSPSTPSPSTPSPQPSQSTPQPSSTASSSSSQSPSSQSQSPQSQSSQNQPSQNQAEQQNSGDPELGGEETAYDQGGSGETLGGEAPNEEVLSQEESVAILDEQLDESMAVFDGMIIDERATAKANESEFPDDEGSVFGDDNPLFEEGDITENSDGPTGSASEEAEGSGGDVYSGNSSENGRETVASRSGGVNTSKGGSQVPSDISDGGNDDIVARQIREAAIKEQDPVLREKLWEEYRKYKQGQ